jgi:hypothetical protein
MTLTLEQVQAQASAIRKQSRGESRVVALRHSGGWTGPDRVNVCDEEHLVLPCVSDLQIREALGRIEASNTAGILLCDMDPIIIGDDVLARLMKRRVHHPQWDEMLRELFAARVLDARILASRPLVDALIRGASAGGYPPAPGGTLDLDSAWRALLKKLLGFEVNEVSFSELVRWTTIPSGRTALSGMAPALRAELSRWLAPSFGDAPRHLFKVMESDLGADLVALGFLFGLLLAMERAGVPDGHAALARLEQYFDNESPGMQSRQTWYQAAAELFGRLMETEVFEAQGIIQNLDRLIDRTRVQAHAHFSDYSRTGLEQRLVSAAEAIARANTTQGDPEIATAREALEHVGKHRLAVDEGLRLHRLRMALRLVLWLRGGHLPTSEATLAQLIDHYATEGGFIDWARRLVVESDPNPTVKEVLRNLAERVDARWSTFQRQFARRLQEWSASDGDLIHTLRIEDILWKIAAPVARQHPALMIVLDGMNQAVFRELLADLLRRNWVELAAPDTGTPRSALAAVPSVTEISRRALLSGQLPVPTGGSEKTDFSNSQRLFEQTGGQSKPQLFLKGDLIEAGRPGLSRTVAQAIANNRCRLVGVVVNAVDDSLGSADQTSYAWGLDQVTPLYELMRQATECGRVVILTSDHGHVLDEGSQVVRQPLPETGDRYRLPGGGLTEDELEFSGPRIRAATGSDSVVVLAASRRRYQGKRRGYHGGVCPGEMVVPCVVLRGANLDVPETLQDLPPYEPDWWSLRATPSAAATPTLPAAKEPRRRDGEKQGELFGKPSTAVPESGDWIELLVVSPTFREQTRATVRGAPPMDQLRQFLSLLDRRNGRMQRVHLAQQLGVPLIRIDGLIQNYRRLLNVDGYDVLAYDQPSETIVLNVELLKSQFELY